MVGGKVAVHVLGDGGGGLVLGVVGVSHTSTDAAPLNGLDLAQDVEVVHVQIHVRNLARDRVVYNRGICSVAENSNVVLRRLRNFSLILV